MTDGVSTTTRPRTEEGRALLDHVDKWGVENAFGSEHTLSRCILTIEEQARRRTQRDMPGLLRSIFIERGWSIDMADNEFAVLDPFAALPALFEEMEVTG